MERDVPDDADPEDTSAAVEKARSQLRQRLWELRSINFPAHLPALPDDYGNGDAWRRYLRAVQASPYTRRFRDDLGYFAQFSLFLYALSHVEDDRMWITNWGRDYPDSLLSRYGVAVPMILPEQEVRAIMDTFADEENDSMISIHIETRDDNRVVYAEDYLMNLVNAVDIELEQAIISLRETAGAENRNGPWSS